MARTKGTRPKGSGIPAGGPGTGKGWGGPAKGAQENPAERHPLLFPERMERTPEEAERVRAKSIARKDRAAFLEELLFDIAMDPLEAGNTRVQAADKALDRLQGKATQRTELLTPDGESLKIEGIRRIIVDPAKPAE